MAENIKVLGGWPSPFVLRARVALNIKSVDYDYEESLAGGVKSELLLKSNPVHKKIPVLIHDDKPVCESLVIVQYIDEVWSTGPAILPSDPYDRATARFWAAFIDEKWFPALSSVALAQGKEGVESAVSQIEEGLALLEEAFGKCSSGKDFFGGDRIGYLDIALGCFLAWVKVAEEKSGGVELIGAAKTPALAKWAERFCADACVKDVMPEKEKLAEFSKVIAARMRAESHPK